jgi:rod shape-determining protein MreD
MNRWLPTAAALVAGIVLQVSLAPHLAVFGIVPNLVFLVVVTVALTQGPVAGGVSGLIGGLVVDLLGVAAVGPYGLVLAVVGYSAGMLSANLFAEGWLLPVTVVAVASLSAEIALGVVLTVLGTSVEFWHSLVTVMLPSAVYHTVLAVVAYPLLARLLRTERPMKSFRRLA